MLRVRTEYLGIREQGAIGYMERADIGIKGHLRAHKEWRRD